MNNSEHTIAPPAADQPLFCANHPKAETRLRCNKCGKPICIKCAKRTPVGFRCRECLHQQQSVFYSATFLDYGLAAAAGSILSVIAAFIMSQLGWFFAIFLGPLIGMGIAEVIRRVSGKRLGRWMPPLAVVCIVLGAMVPLITAIFNLSIILPSLSASQLWNVLISALLSRVNFVYVILAAIAAYARLR